MKRHLFVWTFSSLATLTTTAQDTTRSRVGFGTIGDLPGIKSHNLFVQNRYNGHSGPKNPTPKPMIKQQSAEPMRALIAL